MTNPGARGRALRILWSALGFWSATATCQPAPRVGSSLAALIRPNPQQDPPPPVSGPALLIGAGATSGGVAGPLRAPTPPALPLAVLDFGPRGHVDLSGEPQVRFNQQVAPLGDAMLAEPAVRIELVPRAKGRTRWRTTELLVFEPEGLAPAQRYVARVVALPSASAALKRLFAEQPLTFSFETPGPEVAGSYPAKEEPPEDWTRHQPVLLKLTQPASAAELRKVLVVRDGATPLAVRVDAVNPHELARRSWASGLLEDDQRLAGRLFQVRPVTAWPADRELGLEIAAGLVGRIGVVPSSTPWRVTWKTPGPLRVEALRADAGTCADSSFTLSLSQRIPRSQLSHIHIAPRPPKTVIELSNDWGGEESSNEVQIRGAFVPVQTYAVRLDPELRDVNGYTVGEGNAGRAWTGAATLAGEPLLQISGDGIFPVNTAPVVGVTTRWIQTLRVRAAVLPPARAARALFSWGQAPPLRTFEELGVPVQDIVVRDYPLPVKAPTYWSDLAIDLNELLAHQGGDLRGTVLVEAVPLSLVPAPKEGKNANDAKKDAKGAALFKAPEAVRALVRRTDVGPVAFHSLTRSVLEVVRLSDARPLAHAIVTRLEQGQPKAPISATVLLGRTDDKGLLVLPGQEKDSGPVTLLIEDPAAHDQTLLRLEAPPYAGKRHHKTSGETGGETGSKAGDEEGTEAPLLRKGESLTMSLTLDRDAYRPEESIALVGFALVDTPYTRSGLRLLPAGTPVLLRISDVNQKTVIEQTLAVDGQGKFWSRPALPKGTPLGSLHLTASAQGAAVDEYAKLEDFRTPEFKVSARPARDAILLGERVPIHVHAEHYTGIPVTFDKLVYVSNCRASSHVLPALEAGWVTGDPYAKRHFGSMVSPSVNVPEAKGQSGSATFTPALTTGNEKSLLCSVSTEVGDASHQLVGAESSVRIHPASFYLAVRPPEGPLKHSGIYVGDPALVRVRAVTLEGKRRGAKNVELKLVRSWREEIHETVDDRQRTRWVEHKEIAAACHFAVSAQEDAVCRVEQLKKGTYEIVATAPDDDPASKRVASTRTTFFPWDKPKVALHGATLPKPDARIPSSLEVEVTEVAQVSPHGEHQPEGRKRANEEHALAPGDHLSVTVRSPCASGGGMALLERAGLREERDFVLADHRAAMDFAVDDTWAPHVELEVLTVCKTEGKTEGKTGDRTGDAPPKVEQRRQGLEVSTAQRVLTVDVSAPTHARPGQTLSLGVAVRDAEGQPVKAGHVALWAVDEAVLSLGTYQIRSPLEYFLPRRSSETSTTHEFSSFLRPYAPSPSDPLLDTENCLSGFGGLSGAGYGRGAGGLGGRRSGTVDNPARDHFETTPIFLGEVRLDDTGRAQIEGRLPDNLTTFRITALASAPLVDGVSPGRFGVGTSEVQVSTPFILRPALPRQMRPGDTAEIAAIVQNQTSDAGKVLVEALLGDEAPALALVGESKHEAPLAEGGQLRVPFMIRALRAGTAHVELRARFVPAKKNGETSEVVTDAVRLPVPVAVEPSLLEHTAHYGTLDTAAPIALGVQLPAAVAPDVGGLSLSFSASLLGELQDAFQYLLDYPYGCIEQTSSRVLSLVAARELGQRFGLDATEAGHRLTAGIERILSMQTISGGFAYWPGDEKVHPYATAFATWVLVLAKQSGAAVPGPALEHALDYLTSWVQPEIRVDVNTGIHADANTGLNTGIRAGLDPDLATSGSARSITLGAGRPGDSFGAGGPLYPGERAIALQVLAEAGRPLPKAALDAAVAERGTLPSFARTLLLSALGRKGDPRAAGMLDELLSSMSELPATAHVRENATSVWDALFDSQSRSDAMALRALMQLRPDHPMVPKLVRGLLEARNGTGPNGEGGAATSHAGRWRNTQENAYALLAVLDYAHRFEAVRPDLTARAWVGTRPLLAAALNRPSSAPSVFVPMAQLLPLPRPLPVVIQRLQAEPAQQQQQQQRLYYRLGTSWQELGDTLPSRDQGLSLDRQLRLGAPRARRGTGAVTATAPVTPVVTSIPVGESVAFDLTFRNRVLLTYVAIEVPVPAGLEPVLDNLGQGQGASRLHDSGSDVINHEERRPDRVLLFIDELPPGEHRHTIQLRAITPGEFALPPARAEAMYMPEVYGRTTGGRLSVTGAAP